MSDLGDIATIRRVELFHPKIERVFVWIEVHQGETWITHLYSLTPQLVQGYITTVIGITEDIQPREVAIWSPNSNPVDIFMKKWDDLAIQLVPRVRAFERQGYQIARIRRRKA